MLIAPPFRRFSIHHPEELGIRLKFPFLEPVLWILVATVGFAWLADQAGSIRRGAPLNLPKCLQLAGTVTLHRLTFAYMSWHAAFTTVTIMHNLQYHALV